MKKTLILIFLALMSFALMPSGSFAYISDGPSGVPPSIVNPLDYLKSVTKTLPQYQSPRYQGIGTSVPAIPQLQNIKNYLSGTTGGSSQPSTLTLSKNDIAGSLKSVAVLAINLFLIVIQTVAGILKALLPFLGK